MGVEFSPDMDDEAKLAATRTRADELQEFYDNHHNRGNPMPELEQDPESDDRSDESASGEPVQKAAKTDAEPESEG